MERSASQCYAYSAPPAAASAMRHLPLLFACLTTLPTWAADAVMPAPATDSGRPVWQLVLRGLVVLSLLLGAWKSWRSRKQP